MRAESHLTPRPANFQPLSPVDFLARAAETFPERKAVVWKDRSWTYGDFSRLAARFALSLVEQGIGRGDVVSVMSFNRPEMLAAHYAVPGIGAVLNTINTRLDAETVAYILDHSESRLLISDQACAETARRAAALSGMTVLVLGPSTDTVPSLDLLDGGGPDIRFEPTGVIDEWQPLCINYTSGTTGRPKGVVYHHRGAYLNALGNVMALGLSGSSVYLWTLPMFHCNGWCHTWAVTAAGGVHVCLERPEPRLIGEAIETHGVSHFACAPVVLYLLLADAGSLARPFARRVIVATGGASPTSALIEQLDAAGLDLIHLYGLTESYGPETLCVLPDRLASAPASEKAAYLARQGARHATANRLRIVDADGQVVAPDGVSFGEIQLAGNTLMAGYYGDEAATDKAFADGWFHTGDLAVRHADGAVEIKDRTKDIIISGGENISSLEIESVLHQHPAVLMAAVVAAGDAKWGEIPVAFIELRPRAAADESELKAFCRERLAGFKVPKRFLFQELPKTATGKIQKFVLREKVRS